MKKLLIVLACGLLAGCDYTVPLVTRPETEIDRSVLGLWQTAKEDGQTEQLLVLPLDKHDVPGVLSFRRQGCHVCASLSLPHCWQRTRATEVVLEAPKPKLPEDNRVFQFATYSVKGDTITVRLLNSEVVNKDVASTKELAKAIADNKDNPSLFREAMVFTKVKQ